MSALDSRISIKCHLAPPQAFNLKQAHILNLLDPEELELRLSHIVEPVLKLLSCHSYVSHVLY